MARFNDTFYQLCERFLTQKQWDSHLYSSRHLHRQVNRFCPSYFPGIKLTSEKGSLLEKTFWEIIFGSEHVLSVYGFLKTYIMMVTNMKDYVTLDLNCDDADFRYKDRDNMIAEFKQDLNNRSFNLQEQDKRDDSLQKKITFWHNFVVNQGVPIPDNVYDYDYNENGIGFFFRGSKYDRELGELENFVKINDSKNNL